MNTQISKLIETYFNAYSSADAATIERIFHPDCRLFSVDEKGALEKTPLSDWLGNLRARAERRDFRQGTLEIASIDETAGHAAAAKAVIRFPTATFTDYLSLLRIEGEWRVIGKIYSVSV